MPNDYFQCKQFLIRQDRCGMKVSTVACLFAAWTRTHMLAEQVDGRVLDVGAGTGLLSLFLAQDTAYLITALEIDAAVASQCGDNFNASPFADRLNVLQVDACMYKPEHKVDWIICNPPFFDNDLPSPDADRNRARHQQTLTYAFIARQFPDWLSDQGYCAVLMPFDRVTETMDIFRQAGWNIHARVDIKNKPSAKPSCTGFLFTKKSTEESAVYDISIRDESMHYSNAFVDLLKPYYLNL